jgi:hypothetical protein
MKKKSIIVLAVLSLFTGSASYLKAQDSTLSLGKYLFKTPWIITAGIAHVSDDNAINPFSTSLKTPGNYTNRRHWYPASFAIEKPLYDFKHWNFAKAISLQAKILREGGQPLFMGGLDGNIKYNFRAHFGEKLQWFDPYILGGIGYSSIFYDRQRYRRRIQPTVDNKFDHTIDHSYQRDRFINAQFGIGSNFWINEYVGINLDVEGKISIAYGSTKYAQYSAGLVFKIGGTCKKEEVSEEVKPASTYQRSKEEEDALIHLRQHIEEGDGAVKRIHE